MLPYKNSHRDAVLLVLFCCFFIISLFLEYLCVFMSLLIMRTPSKKRPPLAEITNKSRKD